MTCYLTYQQVSCTCIMQKKGRRITLITGKVWTVVNWKWVSTVGGCDRVWTVNNWKWVSTDGGCDRVWTVGNCERSVVSCKRELFLNLLTQASKLPGETMRPSRTVCIFVTKLVMAVCSAWEGVKSWFRFNRAWKTETEFKQIKNTYLVQN
jgi:hypothetical protein